MNETQAELKIGIGTLEPERVSLKPAKVKIVGVRIEDTKKARKAVFEVTHPESKETIHLSSVAYLFDRMIKITGTWLNLDKEGKLQKSSALVTLLQKLGVTTIEGAIGKECDTELDKGYLVFKAY